MFEYTILKVNNAFIFGHVCCSPSYSLFGYIYSIGKTTCMTSFLAYFKLKYKNDLKSVQLNNKKDMIEKYNRLVMPKGKICVR